MALKQGEGNLVAVACEPPAYLYLRFAYCRCAPRGLDRLRLGNLLNFV